MTEPDPLQILDDMNWQLQNDKAEIKSLELFEEALDKLNDAVRFNIDR